MPRLSPTLAPLAGAATAAGRALIASLLSVTLSAGAHAQQVPLAGAAIPKFVDELPQPPRLSGLNTSPASPAVLRLEEIGRAHV